MNVNQALVSGHSSLISLISISASTTEGIVSKANKSTPASIKAFMRGLCQSLIVFKEVFAMYDPVYSEPSWRDAPYGPTDPATNGFVFPEKQAQTITTQLKLDCFYLDADILWKIFSSLS